MAINNFEFAYIEPMLARTMGNRKLAIVLFEKLFSELSEQLLVMEKTIEQKEFALAEDTAHKLHGSLSFCGFFELKVLAGNLENALQENNFQQSVECLTLLVQETNAFEALEEKILQSLEMRI